MSRTLVLPDSIYRKLTQSASKRGLTVEAWLAAVTNAAQADSGVQGDRRRGRTIERLLAKCRAGSATNGDREELDRLIDEEYRVAVERADARIALRGASSAKPKSKGSARADSGRPRSSRSPE
jgi:hypothetical protein